MRSLPTFFASLLALCVVTTPAFAKPTEADQAALDLIQRIIPADAANFIVDTALPQQDDQDTFSVSDTADGKILLRGNNGVSVASALNWYLKNRAHCHVSWCGDQLDLPSPLPKIGKTVTVSTPLKYRVYFNYCTLSYSAAWWDWERWQREIDFMAMNGINAPLSVVGIEAAWYHTLLKYKFSDAEARQFLVGPGFFAWQWMSNIEDHCGPLPKSWIDSHAKLGRDILDRQRALGMTPIQQGFSGHVPRLLKEKYPESAISFKHTWCNFLGAAQLDPLDPLFAKFGKTFLEEQEKLFGTSHLYGCDPFHEGRPPVEGDEYLAEVGRNIQQLLDAHDPKSVWVMQSWSIRQPMATTVPKDRLLVVDLAGLRHTDHENFWGYDFVTGRLHNFGGRIKLHGDMSLLATNPFASLNASVPNCKGAGLFMEGIVQNPAFYELAFDLMWRDGPVEVNQWLHDYARRRYGAESESANKAWDILVTTAYREGTDKKESSSMLCARPALKPKKSGPNAGFVMPYDLADLVEAWTLLLADADRLKDSSAYRFDVVDVGRQVLSDYAQVLQPRIRAAWEKRDLQAFDRAVADFNTLLLDVDTLVATRPEYSLGKWVTDARSFGTNDEEKNLYERNARTIVTLWGPNDGKNEPLIFDYAWREWSGLIKDYYAVRWQMFHAMLREHLVAGTAYTENGLRLSYGREPFRANPFYSKLADWELNWVNTPAPVTNPITSGDEVALARQLHDKYAPLIRAGQKSNKQDQDDPGKLVGTWSPKTVTNDYRPLTFKITDLIDGEGLYTITFRYSGGPARLNITSVELLQGGKPIAKDVHQGFAGNKHDGNAYTVDLPEHAFGTDYVLRVMAKTDGSPKSEGQVFLRKQP